MNHNPSPLRSASPSALTIFAAAALCASGAVADVVNPWGLSAYTAGNIGTATSGFSGQISSGVMSGGSTYLNNISIGSVAGFGSASGSSILAGSEVIISGSAQGNIDAGWNVSINGATVGGSVRSGNSLKTNGAGGSISGNVTLAGTDQTGNSLLIGGTLLQNQSYAATANIAAYGSFFTSISNQASAALSTGSASLSGTQLNIAASGSGTQFVNISGTDLSAARNIAISAAQDATVVINVSGSAATFNSLGWSFTNGASASRTLFNFTSASDVQVQGNVQATILANSALVSLASGSVSGSVVGLGMIGNGSIGGSQFTGVVPAPGSGALACSAAALCFRRRRS